MFRFVAGRLVRPAVEKAGRRSRAQRLGFESLEARDVPAAYTWLPTGPGAFNWNDAANWAGGPSGTFPNAADDTATLAGALTGNQLINLNVGITVGALTLGSTGVSGYTLAANGAAGSLTFDVSSGPATLTAAGTGGGDAVLAPVVLADDLTLAGSGTAPLALGGDVSGTGTVSATGALTLLTGVTFGPAVPLAGTATVTAPAVLYSTSFYDGALYAFDADTGATLATLVAPNAASSLALPAGLTTGPDGNLYVSNQGFPSQPGFPSNNSIVRYDLSTFAVSTFVTSAQLQAIADPLGTNTLSFAPAGIRFGPDGDLYVSENRGFGAAAPGAVIRFDVADTAGGLGYTGSSTAVADGLSLPNGLTFGTGADATSLYVGSANGIVRVTAATGAAPVAAPLVPAGSSGLEYAAGLAFGPDGGLYVADLGAFTGAGKILRFNPDGTNGSVVVAPGTGAAPGDLAGQFPSDLQFDPQGRLVVVNLGPNGPTQPGPNANDYAGAINRYSGAGVFQTALVTAAQFPDTQDTPAAGDDEATGVIPAQATRVAAGGLAATTVRPGGTGTTGILTVPDFAFAAAGTFAADLNGATAGTGYDRLASTGTVDLNGATLSLTVSGGFTPTAGATFTVVSAAVDLVGQFAGLAEGAALTVGGLEFTISYQGGAGNAVVLTRTASAAPSLSGPFAGTFTVGTPVSFPVTATGTPAPTFALTGTLPAGLTLDPATGLIAGTPTAAGTATVTITATNTFGSDSDTFTFTVNPATPGGVAPQFTSPASASFVAGTGGTFTVTASGTPAPTLALTGTPPAGVTFDPATGALTVDGTAAAGTYTLDFTATNASGTATQAFTLTVTAAGTAPQFTSPNAATLQAGSGATFPVTASGSPTPTLALTGTPPAGVTFDPATGALAADATAVAGTYTLNFTATNPSGQTTQSFTLTVTAADVAPRFTSNPAVSFVAGAGGTFTVTASGTPAPTLAQTGTLPAGVTFDPASGVLTVGTTTPAGTYPLTFTAANPAGTAGQSFTLTLTATGVAPQITSGNATSFVVGRAGTFTVATSGSPTPTLGLSGALPAGVTFDPANGTLSGTPAAGSAGSYPVTVTATNGSGTASQGFTLTVNSLPVITSPTTTTFLAGSAGSFTVTATGSPAPTFTATGLPAGVTLSAAGQLAGTAAAVGTFPVVITATNAAGTAAQNFVLTVGARPTLTGATAGTVAAGNAGAFALTAAGSPAPTLAVTGLPAGATFDPATGVLSVAATTAAGTFPLAVTATNSLGAATGTFTLTVTPPAPPPTTPALPSRLAVSGPADGSASLFDPTAGKYAARPTATPNPFAGLGVTVRTAVADVNGDGTPDTVFVTGPGTAVRFAVVSGKDNATLLVPPTSPFAGSEDFTLGGFVAAADIDRDGRAEVIVTPDQGGGPRVTIFSLPAGGAAPVVRANFFGIDDPAFRGGARAAAGDVNADGTPDLAVAAGFGGGPRVAVFNGTTLFGTPTRLVGDFFAFPGTDAVNLRNGAYVALGDVNGDGAADFIFGGGPGGGPRVFVLDGRLVVAGSTAVYDRPVANFFVAGNSTDRGGVRVAAVDADADGRADVVAGSGTGLPAAVRVYLGKNVTTPAEPTLFQDLGVFGGAVLTDGVYVG